MCLLRLQSDQPLNGQPALADEWPLFDHHGNNCSAPWSTVTAPSAHHRPAMTELAFKIFEAITTWGHMKRIRKRWRPLWLDVGKEVCTARMRVRVDGADQLDEGRICRQGERPSNLNA